jgi:hypothetical protein
MTREISFLFFLFFFIKRCETNEIEIYYVFFYYVNYEILRPGRRARFVFENQG